jgi:rare lipoprotein A
MAVGSAKKTAACETAPDARRYGGVLAAAGAALLLANCSTPTKFASGRHPSELKYGVASSPRVIPEGEPIPKGGGRDMVGKPYVVAGRTYTPHPGKGYDREGWASWYGSAFHGRLTANGEVFDRDSVAAAHPTLPLPSYVRVTNLVNKRSMIVRVNDRGPYERDRVIDLSERAADALGFHRKGTSRVRVQYVGRASLAGSDDEKLLASLRTDGLPASMEQPRTMLAKAPEVPPKAKEEPKLQVAALRPPSKVAARDDDEDDKPAPRRPAQMRPVAAVPSVRAAELETERRGQSVTPPRRPDFRTN